MSVMIFQAGGNTHVWGRKLQTKVVEEDDVNDYLANGWYSHPNEVPDEKEIGGHQTSPVLVDDSVDMGEVSDGYHTFNELYAHRVRLFGSLMHAYATLAWWSRKHSDREEWEGWVIAGITTPEGEITYHLPVEEIDYLPEGTEIEIGKEWDGHTANDMLDRLLSLRPVNPEPRKKPGPKPKVKDDDNSDEG
ncbi:hypothetical protein MXM51_01750 [Pantoea stewartii]|uniref:WDGH domain-containing protein n=1 Tax=Pantoea stewartii TaxID=66269 RepID=UPI002DB60C1E|nr:hypothetical protein [Pantoea stewartii]MEB6533274.1 hypothetical protein [Pantoea stewartii]